MRVISVMNLKGGVAKTITSVNLAYLLQARGARVLLIDMDKQGHASRFYRVRSNEAPSIADVLTDKAFAIAQAIQQTPFGVDVIQANMSLALANKTMLLDSGYGREKRLAKALEPVRAHYDFVVIDHAPDINLATINGLVASNDVIVPVLMDDFALDGLDILASQIAELQEEANPRLALCGCLITQFRKNNISESGVAALLQSGLPVFATKVRFACAVSESTAVKKPLALYAKTNNATVDYNAFVTEYLQKVSTVDTNAEG